MLSIVLSFVIALSIVRLGAKALSRRYASWPRSYLFEIWRDQLTAMCIAVFLSRFAHRVGFHDLAKIATEAGTLLFVYFVWENLDRHIGPPEIKKPWLTNSMILIAILLSAVILA
jgi:hypothetical protein